MIAGLAGAFAHSHGANAPRAPWFIGWYEGRWVGLLLGAFAGLRLSELFHIPDWMGLIAGAAGLYIGVSRLGRKLTPAIERLLHRAIAPPEVTVPDGRRRYRVASILLRAVAIVLFPAMVVGAGALHSTANFNAGGSHQYLPAGRIVALVVSAMAIAYPWFLRRRWSGLGPENPSPGLDSLHFVALPLSLMPAICGLGLFIALGASLTELILFVALSSAEAIAWAGVNPIPLTADGPAGEKER